MAKQLRRDLLWPQLRELQAPVQKRQHLVCDSAQRSKNQLQACLGIARLACVVGAVNARLATSLDDGSSAWAPTVAPEVLKRASRSSLSTALRRSWEWKPLAHAFDAPSLFNLTREFCCDSARFVLSWAHVSMDFNPGQPKTMLAAKGSLRRTNTCGLKRKSATRRDSKRKLFFSDAARCPLVILRAQALTRGSRSLLDALFAVWQHCFAGRLCPHEAQSKLLTCGRFAT